MSEPWPAQAAALPGHSLAARIHEATDLFFARVEANETAGQLAPDIFARLVDLGAIHAMLPRSLGGLQFNALDELSLIEDLAVIDPSTSWVTMATGFCSAAAAAYLPAEAVDDIFAGGRAVIAGAGAPTGVARKTGGGFILTGQWRYGSGLRHANWAHCGAMVEVDGDILRHADGSPVVRVCYVPIHQVSLLDNWDVIGLRATGSVDFSIEDIFVPEARTVLVGDPVHRRGDAIFNQTFTLPTFIGHSGWAAGAARGLLDDLARFVCAQGTRAGAMAGNHGFHEKFAQHEALLRAARALVYATWETVQASADARVALDTAGMSMVRLALVHITEVAAEIAAFAYRIGGGETLRQGMLQRRCRDILAGAQHMTSSLQVKQACGRVLAGLADGEIWSTNGLVKARS